MNSLILLASLMILAEPAPPATIVVVVGAPGTPEYGDGFRRWADRWEACAAKVGADCRRIGGDQPAEQPDRQLLETLLAELPKLSSEPLWLVLIGHGTFDGRSAKFNIRGPDFSAAELAGWLAPFERPLALINCASSSAPFVNRLSGPDRVVITATKSGYELNYARFGDYISAAIADPQADLDKDQQTSLLEAFLSASAQVADFYEQAARLATETAILDDNGDGLGTPAEWFRGVHAVRRARDGAATDGSRAHQIHLVPSRQEREMPPEVRRRRDQLEMAVARLRDAKGTMTEEAYYAELEPLMLELARLYATLEDAAGTPQPPAHEQADERDTAVP